MKKIVALAVLALVAAQATAAPLCTNGQVWNPTGPVTQTGGVTVSVLPTFTGRNLTDTTQGGWQNSVGVPEKVLMVCSNGPILKAHEAQMSFVSASTNGAQSRIDASYAGNQTSDVGCNGGGVTSAPINATFRVTGACGANVPDPEPTECEEKRDDGSLRNRLLFVSPGQTGLICDSGCMMNLGTVNTDTGESTHLRINTAGGGANYTQGVRATYTGQPCSGTPQLSDVEVDLETMPGGKEGVCKGTDPKACIIPEKPNCGHVNGEYRCFTANNLTPENPCNTTASGAVFCRADAPDSAKPNNGTEGQPATPDVEFTLQKPGDTSGTVINYYKPSTVQGDSNDPGNDDEGEASGNGDCGSAAKPCKVEVVNGDEIGGGEGGGGGGEGAFVTPQGEYGYEDLQGEIDDARQNLKTTIETIRAEAQGLFGSTPSGGGGGLPCDTAQVMGSEVSVCLADYEDELAPIGAILLLISAAAAALIILKGGK